MDEQPREGWLKAMPYVMVAVYVVVPLLLIPLAGTRAAAAMIVFLFTAAGLIALIDAFAFRPTLSMPLLAGLGFVLAKALYLNDGTMVYGLACVAIAGVGTLTGSALGKRR